MAELTFEYAKYIGEKFISEYNVVNETNFSWDDNRSHQAAEPFDITFYDGKKELGVQHKKVVSDPEREIVRWNKVEPVINELRRVFKKWCKPALLVHLNFHKPPKTKSEAEECAFWLEEVIQHKVSSAIRPGYFTYKADYDDEYLPKIKEWVSELDILPHPDLEKEGVVFSYGTAGARTEPWPDNFQSVMKVMEKIKTSYANPENIIVLLENYTFSVGSYYRKQIEDGLKDYLFKEIWIVETYTAPVPVFRVK